MIAALYTPLDRGLPKTPAPVPAPASPIRLPECAELAAWREIGPDLDLVVSAFLADQGDRASPELIALQHRLAALLRLPANTSFPV